ncbi:hypothetical protein D9613_007806 [Agrocybe pediades]|uniref:Aminoglycoside phosphotransferase domain-containing protein n=1 Tax=Agrocybe pediades TaxID=84607 RepID=A0A8H4VLL1_9AGAR|nr:hypothetical protein D9613_007806 [Agrocybe pediades]
MPIAYDFGSYLRRTTGVHGWHVEELSGGAANFTVRARQTKHQDQGAQQDANIFRSEPTFVIKQAPSHFAKLPNVPFSPYRQTVEAEALRQFHEKDSGNSNLQVILARNPLIRIPRLLTHDAIYGILVQSDLGSHPNLHEALTSSHMSLFMASILGATLGHFLADLHSSAMISPEAIRLFHNGDAARVMEGVISQATSFMRDAGVDDFQVLGDWALKHWRNREKIAFSQGDLWFGTLLIDVDAGSSARLDTDESAKSPIIGICDREFAGPNHPAADIAQLVMFIIFLATHCEWFPLKHFGFYPEILSFDPDFF